MNESQDKKRRVSFPSLSFLFLISPFPLGMLREPKRQTLMGETSRQYRSGNAQGEHPGGALSIETFRQIRPSLLLVRGIRLPHL